MIFQSQKTLWRFVIIPLILNLTFAPCGWPWGNEGHRIIAVNAVALLPSDLKRAFIGHNAEFGYYANVPDVVWRRIGVNDAEGPTHYVNMENFKLWPGDPKFPTDPKKAEGLFRKPSNNPKANFRENGISPWRVEQLHALLTSDFEEAGLSGKESKKAEFVGLHAGIMGHYAGDAAQPLHATYDHDGKLSGHGGLHAYFETEIVEALSKRHHLVSASLKIARDLANRQKVSESPVRAAFDLLAHSHQHVKALFELDNRFALIPNGHPDSHNHLPRLPAAKVAVHFATLTAERLAIGSVTLAQLIEKAWIQVGKPALPRAFGRFIKFPSYIYPTL